MRRTRQTRLLLFLFVLLPLFAGAQAQQAIDSLATVLKTLPDDTTKINTLCELAKACSAIERLKADQGMKGINAALEAKTLAQKLGRTDKAAEAQLHLGNIYKRLERPDDAVAAYIETIRLCEGGKNDAILARACNNLGYVHLFSTRNMEKARHYLQQAYTINMKLGNKRLAGGNLGNIGTSYSSEGSNREALDYNNKALALFREVHDTMRMAMLLGNNCDIYTDLRDFERATKALNESELFFQKKKEESGAIIDAQRRGYILFLRGNDAEAEKLLLACFDRARQQGDKSTAKQAAETLAKIYEKQKNYEAAFRFRSEFYTLKDSLDNNEQRIRIFALENNLDLEKLQKEQDIRLKVSEVKHDEENRRSSLIIWSVVILLTFSVAFLLYVFDRLRLIRRQKATIEQQQQETEAKNAIIENKNKEITDSINYAKRIQYALLAHEQLLLQHLPQHFVFFLPKDIVSGDFYWAAEKNGRFYLAVCDCTGHGVPGAFMSLLTISYLHEAISEKEIAAPGEVFDFVRRKLIENIAHQEAQDGMDGLLICFDKPAGKITYAAAYNAPLLAGDGTLTELPADKMPVGKGPKEEPFRTFPLEWKTGDTLYLFTDGFADQFGGPAGKKFKYKQLYALLAENRQLTPSAQKELLRETFSGWQGALEQIDDVLVAGIRL